MIKKERWKEIGIRAAKTALQAFCGAITIDAATLEGGASVWRAMLISALAAALSAAMNTVIAALEEG